MYISIGNGPDLSISKHFPLHTGTCHVQTRKISIDTLITGLQIILTYNFLKVWRHGLGSTC